jgi:hypothetical protein
MPEPHYVALYAHYPEIIALMPPEFSSHAFILRLFQRHQREFIEALWPYRNADAPMRQVTSQLSRYLHQYSHLVRHVESRPSEDIFGDTSACAFWRKVDC